MRTLNIEVTDSAVVYPDGKLAGRIGEHNATQLIIALPELLLDGVDYHIISFDTLRGSVVSGKITSDNTKEAYIIDGSICCTLWQELTRSPALMFTVEAYAVTDNEPVMIAKSPYIDELYFELSADDNADEADTGGYGLVCEVDKLKQIAHSHLNRCLLDSYTQTETELADAVSKKHAHTNQTMLDTVNASFNTKADKTVPSNEGALASLDGNGNLCDSGFAPNDFVMVIETQGSGTFNTTSAFNGFTSVGSYSINYKNTTANTVLPLLLDVSDADGAVTQYVYDRGSVWTRQRISDSWGNWSKTSFVSMSSGTVPAFGHIPVFINSASSHVGATVTDSGCSVNDFVQKIAGMGLSTNDFSEYYKDKLDAFDPNAYYHTGENIDLNRYYTAGLHIFVGTLDGVSRPWDNAGKALVVLVTDVKRDETLEKNTCLQYALGNSTIVYRTLEVNDSGLTAVGAWTTLGGDIERLGVDSDGNITVDDTPVAYNATATVVGEYDDLPTGADEGDLAYVQNDMDSGEGAPIDLTECPASGDVDALIQAAYTAQGGTVDDSGWSAFYGGYTNCDFPQGRLNLGNPTYRTGVSYQMVESWASSSALIFGLNHTDDSLVAVDPVVFIVGDSNYAAGSENVVFVTESAASRYMSGVMFNTEHYTPVEITEDGVTKFKLTLGYIYAYEALTGEFNNSGMIDEISVSFTHGWNELTVILDDEGTVERVDTVSAGEETELPSMAHWMMNEGSADISTIISEMLDDTSQPDVLPKGLYISTTDGWRWIG